MRTMSEQNGPTLDRKWDQSGKFSRIFNGCGAPKGGRPVEQFQTLSEKWDQNALRNSLKNFQFGPTIHHVLRVAMVAFALLISPAVMADASRAAVPHSVMSQIGQGRPAGCPRLWCGCFLSKVFGVKIWRAVDWRHWGQPAKPGAVGSVAVMRGHVGLVTGQCGPNQIKIVSGNHNHRVGQGCYPRSRIIAWRQPKANAYALPKTFTQRGNK